MLTGDLVLRHVDYTRDRIRQLVARIHDRIYYQRHPFAELRVAGPTERISVAQAQELREFREARLGDRFGPAWATHWFAARFEVPKGWAGSRVDLLWDSQSEATLWIDGKSVQGLNMTQGDRPDAILLDRARGGEALAVQIEMACNRKFGVSQNNGMNMPFPDDGYMLRRCEIARFDPRAWNLYFDAVTHLNLYLELEKDGDVSEKSWAGLLLSELNRFCNTIQIDNPSTWEKAQGILKKLYQHGNADRQFELSAIGHAHIDTAWLWPLAETHRKCERTFSTATAYMRDYPEYRFSCSQAYQYSVIKARNSDLYERIGKAIKRGQWNVVGGTWIEPDCNIPSGESLCRQFLFGQRYFQREFGIRCKEFWNPDVFGYNGQLPQIMRLAGITRFLTQKLSWNRFNKPQHHTFTWQGIDGSEVLAHFPPADSYNAMQEERGLSHVAWLRNNVKLYKDHDRANHGFMLFGYGDGGGGPTKPMLETLRRVHDLQGVPRTEQRSSEEFFELLEKNLIDRPLQIGELYFEYHRGTYTSQALVKRNNRKAEFLLHDLEFLAAMSTKPYPREAINKLWEVLLLNQFHDILPGSSIREVYEDSARQFHELFEQGEELIESIAGRGNVLVNTTSFARTDVIEHGGKLSLFKSLPHAAAAEAQPEEKVTIEQQSDTFVLRNKHLVATFKSSGELMRLLHRSSGRETVAAPGNIFETYDDTPTMFDAWDIDPFHLETVKPTPLAYSAKIIRSDPLRGEISFERAIGKSSSMKQTVRLDADSRRLEFHCQVDWQENQTLLKVAFPVNVRAMNATYEMHFGHVERPTHYNTSFDLARYEVPYHKWFDFSEHGFGCAILSESKYGGSTFGNTMRMSLLRSPMAPDSTCDRGRHEFSFALLPHANGWRESGVVAEAFAFNSPLRAVGSATNESFFSTADPNIVIDTIKKAEDDESLIVRLYECHGARGVATIRLPASCSGAHLCNILEEDLGELALRAGSLHISYTPHQILSIKMSCKPA
jgi:alpha-mannosidase